MIIADQLCEFFTPRKLHGTRAELLNLAAREVKRTALELADVELRKKKKI